jgi:hypothetical protein
MEAKSEIESMVGFSLTLTKLFILNKIIEILGFFWLKMS